MGRRAGGAGASIFRYTQNDAEPWAWIAGLGGNPIDIGAAADGTVFVINSNGDIHRYGDDETWKYIQPTWDRSGSLIAISAGSRTNVWGVHLTGNIYCYTPSSDGPWVQIPGGLSDIGAGVDGAVWGVNSAGNIYHYIRT